MASQDFQALLDKAEQHPALADTLRTAGTLEGLVEVGRREGFAFTAVEARAALEAVGSSGELGERELDAVAGGTPQPYLKYELKNVYVTSYSV